MKKITGLFIIIITLIITAACGNELKSDINDYKAQMRDVQTEEKALVKEVDKLGLDKVDQLIGSEVTEAKKEKLLKIEEHIESTVKPQLKKYEKSVEKVKPSTKEVKDVHKIYLNNLKKKKEFINQLSTYMTLFNDSIESNEEILQYTKIFEKNKTISEKFAVKASKKSSDSAELDEMSNVINNNSEALKSKIEKMSALEQVSQKQKYIDDELIPLLKSQVQKLNKTKLKSKNIIGMRDAAIEINYSLIKYYEERKNTMEIEHKLQKMPMQEILENPKHIRSMDEKYYEALKKLEEK